MSAPQFLVGLDVANAQRPIALRPTGERWAVPHDATGMAALVVRLQAMQPTRMGLEATGGDHRAVAAARAAAAWPIVVVNPRQGRGVANATGPLAHTGAHAAEAVRPGPRPLPAAQTAERRARLARRRP
jgi:transposase